MTDIDVDLVALNEKRSIPDLKLRCDVLDKIIREAQKAKDPRADALVAQHERMMAVLVQKIKEDRVQRGVPEPEPVVVQMKQAEMKADRLRTQGRRQDNGAG